MSQITGGVITIEDGVKSAEEFAPARKVRIEFRFEVGENEDGLEFADIVRTAVNERIAAELGRRITAPTAAVAAINDDKAKAATGPKRGPGRPRAEKPAETHTLKPAAASVDDELNGPATPAAEPTKPAEDSLDDVFGETAKPEPVSDADLNTAVQKKNGEIASPPKIRALANEFKPADHTGQFVLRDIPQDRRQEFLTKLEALTKD